MSEKYVLDACSPIAYFRDEDGAAIVEGLFDDASEDSATDHHEFDPIDESGRVKFPWIR